MKKKVPKAMEKTENKKRLENTRRDIEEGKQKRLP